MSGVPPEIIVCHTLEDAAHARTAAERLERGGISCAISVCEARPGKDADTADVGAIETAKGVVLVFSRHAAASLGMLKAMRRALDAKRRVIVLGMDGTPLLGLFEILSFGRAPYVNVPDLDPRDWPERLIEEVELALGRDRAMMEDIGSFGLDADGGDDDDLPRSSQKDEASVDLGKEIEAILAPAKPSAHAGSVASPPPKPDWVCFSAFAPAMVAPGSGFVLDIWAHLDAQRAEVACRAGELARPRLSGVKGPEPVARGTRLSVTLDLPGFEIADPVDTLLWLGEPANASFQIEAPRGLASGTHAGRAVIHSGGAPILKLVFEVIAGAGKSAEPAPLPAREFRPKRAFASYASDDRAAVLARAQGIRKGNPGLDLFLDVVSLRSGQRWEQELEREIASREVLFLFWSRRAAASEWVAREWRVALDAHGLDGIDPIPLEEPSLAPPPAELGGLHFNDHYLAHMRATG